MKICFSRRARWDCAGEHLRNLKTGGQFGPLVHHIIPLQLKETISAGKAGAATESFRYSFQRAFQMS